MRITYLHQYFTTPDGATGTRSYELARRMVASGHRVTMICSDAQLPPETGDSVAGIALRVVRVAYTNEMGTAARLRAFVLFALRASIVAARTPADVIYASSTPLTIALPGIVGRLARRAPLVFEVRDLWPDVPIRLGVLHGRLPIAIARGLELLAYRASAAVVALSPGMADGVAARGIACARIHTIPNGCDVALFDVPESAGETVRASVPGLAPGAPLIVHVGALGAVNDVGWLAELAGRLRPLRPDARFLVVGRGRDRERVLARARQAGVLDETLFVRDPIPKRDVPALLAAATVSCAISVPEVEANSSNKLFDTLAAGRPALINYGGWQQALLEESGAGLVLPRDDLDRAAALLAAFLDDPARQQGARAAAARLARERFNRDQQAGELIALLEAAASAAKR